MVKESNLVFTFREYIVVFKILLGHYNLLLYAFAYALRILPVIILVD